MAGLAVTPPSQSVRLGVRILGNAEKMPDFRRSGLSFGQEKEIGVLQLRRSHSSLSEHLGRQFRHMKRKRGNRFSRHHATRCGDNGSNAKDPTLLGEGMYLLIDNEAEFSYTILDLPGVRPSVAEDQPTSRRRVQATNRQRHSRNAVPRSFL